MSVYCGFATRKQEHIYNTVLCKLLKLMSEKLITLMNLSANTPIGIPNINSTIFIINSDRWYECSRPLKAVRREKMGKENMEGFQDLVALRKKQTHAALPQ